MSKKVEKPIVRAVQKIDPEKQLRLADDEWSNELERANQEYDKAMEAAWRKYAIALKLFLEQDKKAKTGEQDFHKLYIKERAAALEKYHTQMDIAGTVFDDVKERYRKATKL